ncbi:hypothetical protein GUJ93_ZPchr0011g28524 [Zizania palustris]|uniref:RING-type domain-containing protein n=1 Tax=Zizania palustris TaxID=103762 RepID=A0A8J5WDD3_ZIZPA|nr:hypothetical protein GUJ93_ZPchr0011g28524 [Zizania palustris]
MPRVPLRFRNVDPALNLTNWCMLIMSATARTMLLLFTGHLVYTFNILKDQNKNNVKIVLDIENAKCSICLNLWHDVVTVAPCFHNFCNGCFSEWLRRSSANSRDKIQGAACPQCRTSVQSVGRNHFLHNIEEAILQAFSSLQRSDEEIALLESYASVKSNIHAIWTLDNTRPVPL